MYRDDLEAVRHRADAVSREAAKLKAENAAMREAMSHAPPPPRLFGSEVYLMDVRNLPLPERSRLATHQVTRFPVWAIGVLNIVTFGLFPLIHFGLIHDKLPRAAHNDPTSGKAIGFTFIPYFNLYWIFFNALRLADRLDLQFRLRNSPLRAPKGMLIAACIFGLIPYIGLPIMWTIAVCMLQSKVNRVAATGIDDWDATPGPYDRAPATDGESQEPYAAGGVAPNQPPYAGVGAAPTPFSPAGYQPPPEVAERQKRARRLVMWSHLLGWGGLGVLLIGTAAAAIAAGPTPAGVVAGVAAIAIVTGAIVGQIGRGMQGRAI